MRRHALLYFALGVTTVVSIGAVSLSENGITFSDGSVQTTAAPTDARPAFYLTTDTFTGDLPTAVGVCDDGFHFASMWEILDVSSLRYDATRGLITADSGSGPPVSHWGWVRTGGGVSHADSRGEANCGVSQPWDSSSSEDSGTVVSLPSAAAHPWSDPPTRISPWIASTATCNMSINVWCVEDAPGAGG
jgi:hypothetical protein